MEEIEKFIESSTEAFHLYLYRPGTNVRVDQAPFKPWFTYPIFGTDEMILGYRTIVLDLRFRATDMKPRLEIKWKEKWKGGVETKPMQVREMLKDYSSDFDWSHEYPEEEEVHDREWEPPGQLIKSYAWRERKFEIWQTTFAEPTALEMFHNFKILIPFYIEGGSLQTERGDEMSEWTRDRWKLFLVYEVTPLAESHRDISPYTFVGFATSYRLWVMPTFSVLEAAGALPPNSTNGDAEQSWKPTTATVNEDGMPKHEWNFDGHASPSRERISQFVILPPFQHQSHGTQLYNAMVREFMADKNVFEITVEDPSELFDDMRDWCDLVRLNPDPMWQSLALPETLPKETLKPKALVPIDLLVNQDKMLKLRRKYKIAPRQFSRLTEMHLLNKIPDFNRVRYRIARKEKCENLNDRKYYFWRLLVKERIWDRNSDVLMQLETREEKVEKVVQAIGQVQEEYNQLLKKLPQRIRLQELEDGTNEERNRMMAVKAQRATKRTRVTDDDDDEDEDEKADKEENETSAKKPRLAAKVEDDVEE